MSETRTNSVDIVAQTQQEDVHVTCTETYYQMINVGTHTVVGFLAEPTREQVIAHGVPTGQMYPEDAFDICVVDIYADPTDANSPWKASVSRGDWAPCEREVQFSVPVAQLPANFTTADIVAWGRDHGTLNPLNAGPEWAW